MTPVGLGSSCRVDVSGVCIKCGRDRGTIEEVLADGERLLENVGTKTTFVDLASRCRCGAKRVQVKVTVAVE